MSELPRGWVSARLSDVVTPRGERVSPQSHPDKQFVGLEHVEAHSTRILGGVPASEVKSAASVFKSGDVLYGRLRPYLNKVARPDFDGLASAEFIVFPDQDHLRSGYLKHRLNASDFVSFASRLNAGDRPRVDFEQIGDFVVELPPPAEQQRVVEKLEELLSDLDAGIAALERARANLKRYRAAVLKAAVEGRLTEKWRAANPDVEPASKLLERILAERRKRWEEAQLKKFADKGQSPPKGWKEEYSEPTMPRTTGLPKLPPSWCWANLDQLKHWAMYGPRFPGSAYDQNGDCLVLRTTDFSDEGAIDLQAPPRMSISSQDYARYRAEPYDLMITRTGSLGTLAVFQGGARAIAGAFLLHYRLITTATTVWYVYYFLRSPGGNRLLIDAGRGVGRPNLNMPSVDAIPIPFPPLEEQAQVNAGIEMLQSEIRRVETETQRSFLRSKALRQAILKQAFEGKLVPQDPKDEPASELLARIRAGEGMAKRRARGGNGGAV